MELAGERGAPLAQRPVSRRRRWLKGLILAVTAAVIAAGSWDYAARRQKRAAQAILALHGRVGYADEMPFQGPNSLVRWLRDEFGHDYTSSVALVQLGNSGVSSEDLQCLKALQNLRALWLNDTAIGDAALKRLSGNSRLEELSLRNARITDQGLAELSSLRRLEFLYLQDNDITDAGLAHLESLTSLKLLKLDGTRVTPRGVRKLQQAMPLAQISY